MRHRVSFDFRLARHARWSGNGSGFYGHIEDVRQKIEAHELVSEVRVITDLAESSLTIDFVFDAAGYVRVGEDATRLVREAIEGCDARHFGMESVGSGFLVGAGAHSGLETPIWHKRRVLIDHAA